MGESVIAEIVEAIAEEEGVNPAELDFTLQDHIDTDALQLLLDHKSTSWTLMFDIAGHEVSVTGDRLVQVNSSQSEINV